MERPEHGTTWVAARQDSPEDRWHVKSPGGADPTDMGMAPHVAMGGASVGLRDSCDAHRDARGERYDSS